MEYLRQLPLKIKEGSKSALITVLKAGFLRDSGNDQENIEKQMQHINNEQNDEKTCEKDQCNSFEKQQQQLLMKDAIEDISLLNLTNLNEKKGKANKMEKTDSESTIEETLSSEEQTPSYEKIPVSEKQEIDDDDHKILLQKDKLYRTIKEPFYHKYKLPGMNKARKLKKSNSKSSSSSGNISIPKGGKKQKQIEIKAPFLPKKTSQHEYTLALDLDKTLIYSQQLEGDLNFDCYHTFYRPYLLEFLDKMSQHYEIIIFTAADQDYADKILQQIDFKKEFIQHRLYKQHLKFTSNVSKNEMITSQYKDLSLCGRDVSKMILIDDLEVNFSKQPNNGILIPEWKHNNPKDECLKQLIPYLENISKNQVKLGQTPLQYNHIFV